jgi:hypothetical protein
MIYREIATTRLLKPSFQMPRLSLDFTTTSLIRKTHHLPCPLTLPTRPLGISPRLGTRLARLISPEPAGVAARVAIALPAAVPLPRPADALGRVPDARRAAA